MSHAAMKLSEHCWDLGHVLNRLHAEYSMCMRHIVYWNQQAIKPGEDDKEKIYRCIDLGNAYWLDVFDFIDHCPVKEEKLLVFKSRHARFVEHARPYDLFKDGADDAIHAGHAKFHSR